MLMITCAQYQIMTRNSSQCIQDYTQQRKVTVGLLKTLQQYTGAPTGPKLAAQG